MSKFNDARIYFFFAVLNFISFVSICFVNSTLYAHVEEMRRFQFHLVQFQFQCFTNNIVDPASQPSTNEWESDLHIPHISLAAFH